MREEVRKKTAGEIQVIMREEVRKKKTAGEIQVIMSEEVRKKKTQQVRYRL